MYPWQKVFPTSACTKKDNNFGISSISCKYWLAKPSTRFLPYFTHKESVFLLYPIHLHSYKNFFENCPNPNIYSFFNLLFRSSLHIKRRISYNGPYSTFTYFMETLLDLCKNHLQRKHDDNKKKLWAKPPLQAQGGNCCRWTVRQLSLYYTKQANYESLFY